MLGNITRRVGHAVLNRSTMAGLGAAALAAPVGAKVRQRQISRGAAKSETFAGLRAAALAAPVGLGAMEVAKRLRKRGEQRSLVTEDLQETVIEERDDLPGMELDEVTRFRC